jgi:hypothetical protein
MGADQIAAIAPALRELQDARRSGDSRAHKLCASLSITGNSSAWIQVVGDQLNFGYPRSDDPVEYVRHLNVAQSPSIQLVGMTPNSYATLAFGDCDIYALARLIDRLFAALHSLQPNAYDVDVEVGYL